MIESLKKIKIIGQVSALEVFEVKRKEALALKQLEIEIYQNDYLK